MIRHITRQFGLIILGLCILISGDGVAGAMQGMKAASATLAGQVQAESLCREVVTTAIDPRLMEEAKRATAAQPVVYRIPGHKPLNSGKE